MKLLITGLLLSTVAFATENDLKHRPKSFNVSQGTAVFVDFTEAQYHITYDLEQKKAAVKADISFYAPEAGLPIFDSYDAPATVKLNGSIVDAIETKTPSNETTVRVVNSKVAVGNHKLTVEMPLSTLVEFNGEGVKSAFWTSDLTERKFLERYMPANLEFDQVKMTFFVKFLGAKIKQVIYTNGDVKELESSSYKISYPHYYTASSIFYHTVPQGAVDEMRFSVKSVDGREIPGVIYVGKSIWGSSAATLEKFKNETIRVFHELEGDYGAFPHPSITVYNAGAGGMEYCGATITEYRALGHELFHSYFARGVMPANGNAGWLDEALASWRDNGYRTSDSLSGSSMMSSHPYYTRTTDRAAYSFGERFMRYMDGKLKADGGLKPFLRYMVEKKVFSPLHVQDFIQEMNAFYGKSLDADFQRYTFGKANDFSISEKNHHPIHRKMTLDELKNYL